mgnify:CR=1 FL=1
MLLWPLGVFISNQKSRKMRCNETQNEIIKFVKRIITTKVQETYSNNPLILKQS